MSSSGTTSNTIPNSNSAKTAQTKGKSKTGLYIGIFIVVFFFVVAILVGLGFLIYYLTRSSSGGTANGQSCTNGSDCQSGNCVGTSSSSTTLYCQPSSIANSGIVGASCALGGAPCNSGLSCTNGTCQTSTTTKQANGTVCTQSSQCQSSYCSILLGGTSGYCQPNNTPTGTQNAVCTLSGLPGCNSGLNCTLGSNGIYTCQSTDTNLGNSCTTDTQCGDGEHCVGYNSSLIPITGYGSDQFCQLSTTTYSGMNGATCNTNALCAPGLVCQNGLCTTPTFSLPAVQGVKTELANQVAPKVGYYTYSLGSTAACKQAQDSQAIGWLIQNNSQYNIPENNGFSLYQAGGTSTSPVVTSGICDTGSYFYQLGQQIPSGTSFDWTDSKDSNGQYFTIYPGAQLYMSTSNNSTFGGWVDITNSPPGGASIYYFVPTTLNPQQNWIFINLVDDSNGKTYALVKIF